MSNSQATPRNLLLLSGGSKVAIARIAKKAASKRGITLHISDTDDQVPCRLIADQFDLLPIHTDPTWEQSLLNLCQSAKIGLIIPTRHRELMALGSLKPKLEELGTTVSLSGCKTLQTCIHKFDTFNFLNSIEVPTPATLPRLAFDPHKEDLDFPLIAKPENGSASQGIIEANAILDLDTVPNNWILQEKANGAEFTINLYIRQDGLTLCVIPHQRILVESGEVVQAKTRRIEDITTICKKIAHALPDPQGIINIQLFYNESPGETSVIEINPRIGGGYPLCDAAKGHYIEWLCQEHIDKRTPEPFDAWTSELLMMRYREALFCL